MKNIFVLAALGSIFLSGCGGGGSKIEPISVSGFAESGDVVEGGTAFSIPKLSIAEFSRDDVSKFNSNELDFVISNDGQSVTVTIDDDVLLLEFNAASGRFENTDLSRVAFSRRKITAHDAVGTSYLYVEDDQGVGSYGFFTYGFDTDPAVIGRTTGNATYSGEVELAFDGKERFSFADAELLMNVDFDTSKVSGAMIVEERFSTQGLNVPAGVITMQSADISGNGFSGTLSSSLDGGSFTGTQIDTSNYTGRFFGSEGQEIGGDLNAVFVDSSGEPAISMVGGFAGASN